MPCKLTTPKRAEARRPDTGAPKAEKPKTAEVKGDTPKGKGKKPAVAAEQLRRGKEAK